MTFQWIIRRYADLVLKGQSDTDLTARQRKYLGVLLNLASNRAGTAYPPTPEDRERLVDYMIERAWDTIAFLTPKEAEDMNEASPRAAKTARQQRQRIHAFRVRRHVSPDVDRT